ncbi:MAG TPA: NB-ARC domain-containing protein [Thauera aminoaromatica]|nr:NB-ARC domain-containing protein [Thauera aminoaromatica]
MPAPPENLRVFVASPGDVAAERRLALEVINGMQRRWFARGKVTLDTVEWDDDLARVPMAASATPEDSVIDYLGRPRDCELTVVILWSRIGTRLPNSFRRADGSAFESGTVWELEDARDRGRDVWVYRCTRPLEITGDDLKAQRVDEKLAQYRAVEAYFVRAFQNPDGSLKGSVNTFDTPTSFGKALGEHLEAFITRRIDALRGASPRAPAGGAGAGAKPWLVREPVRDYHVVGRAELVDRVWRKLRDGVDTSLLFLPGVGKTTVAQELLRERDKILGHFDGVLWANLGRQHVDSAELRAWGEALGIPAERMNSFDDKELWLRALQDAIGDRCMLVVLDDVWRTEDARRFMELGPRCVFLSTTRSKTVAKELGAGELVPELDPPQAFGLLCEVAPGAVEADPMAAKALLGTLQGLPLAIVLVGKVLRRAASEAHADPARLRRAYDEVAQAGRRLGLLRPEDQRTLGEVIELSFGALRSDAARDAATALSIFRPKPNAFGRDIALAVGEADEQTLEDIGDIGLIEQVGKDVFTMHRIIAEYARTRLPLQRSQALHRKALAFYAEKLRGSIESDPDAYLSWYRHEWAEWQETKDACLYHTAHSGDSVAGVLAFLRVFFDAFWWWGYYQRFPFCERLVVEWRQRELDARARALIDQVAAFQDAYPAGPDKRAGGDWVRAESALLGIRKALGLDGDGRHITGEDARRVRAFTDFFLAEARAYGRDERDEALRFYEAARSLFLDDGVSWVAAWIEFYVAQYLLERGEFADARPHALRSLAEGAGEFGERAPLAGRDSELIANDYRLLGDLALAADEVDAAARAHGRATLYAYVFQAIPEPVDTYTMDFYGEIVGRVAASIARCGSGDPRGRALALALHAFWRPWRTHCGIGDERDELNAALDAGDPGRLAAALFPPAPAVDAFDFIDQAASYSRAVLAVVPSFVHELGPLDEFMAEVVRTLAGGVGADGTALAGHAPLYRIDARKGRLQLCLGRTEFA